ncbi:unnamed protein product [Notodromas monacha]|uniref:RNA helicase n=1 Tax=Notodromas monacha TaxID=399045 RepID=A0A7R9BNL0_9CRUS|nr:unnamed protein product [Notodromas monacha]CAG0918824.1 unnamed protein product [Notodromas monacha]
MGENRIFFVDVSHTSEPLDLSFYSACAMESTARKNPGRIVQFFVRTQRNLKLNKFSKVLETFDNLQIGMLPVNDLIVPAWDRIGGQVRDIHQGGNYWWGVNLSDIVRLLILWKYGGFYLDADIISLKPLDGLENSVGCQYAEDNRCKRTFVTVDRARWQWEITVLCDIDVKSVLLRECPDHLEGLFEIGYIVCPETEKEDGRQSNPLQAAVDPSKWENTQFCKESQKKPLEYVFSIMFAAKTSGTFKAEVEVMCRDGSVKTIWLEADITGRRPDLDVQVVKSLLSKHALPQSIYERRRIDRASDSDRRLLDDYSLQNTSVPTILDILQIDRGTLSDSDLLKACLHCFLYVEEVTLIRMIMRFSGNTTLAITESFLSEKGGGLHIRQGGNIYGIIDVAGIKDESTEAQVFHSLASIAHFQIFTGTRITAIFEGELVEKQERLAIVSFDSETTSKHGLRGGICLEAFVSFLPNRLPFCEKHGAVDALKNVPLDQKSVEERIRLFDSQKDSSGFKSLRSGVIVDDYQAKALRAILSPPAVDIPAILITGPYGTGKTYTLGTAAIEILTRQPESRILICTQSNSAADLYVIRFFSKLQAEERRWFSPFRYCNLKPNSSTLVRPQLEDILSRRVVITTCSTARLLIDAGVRRDFFTHIFLDEAGQALVSEALIPLTLCSSNTRVILAGDPKQVFGRAFYPGEIMELPQELRRRGTKIHFYHLGDAHEVDEDGYSYNRAQTFYAEAIVRELKESDGADSVAVITPTRTQISFTRNHFRNVGLGDVTVDSVAGFQGIEFKHIVLLMVMSFRGSGLEWIADTERVPESDVHMTVTACTRAVQSVSIIGNAFYLCLTRHTGRLWRTILEYCFECDTVVGVLRNTFKNEIMSYEHSKKYNWNVKAAEFCPQQRYSLLRPRPPVAQNFLVNPNAYGYGALQVPRYVLPPIYPPSSAIHSAGIRGFPPTGYPFGDYASAEAMMRAQLSALALNPSWNQFSP